MVIAEAVTWLPLLLGLIGLGLGVDERWFKPKRDARKRFPPSPPKSL